MSEEMSKQLIKLLDDNDLTMKGSYDVATKTIRFSIVKRAIDVEYIFFIKPYDVRSAEEIDAFMFFHVRDAIKEFNERMENNEQS